jgi:hypothetical protein
MQSRFLYRFSCLFMFHHIFFRIEVLHYYHLRVWVSSVYPYPHPDPRPLTPTHPTPTLTPTPHSHHSINLILWLGASLLRNYKGERIFVLEDLTSYLTLRKAFSQESKPHHKSSGKPMNAFGKVSRCNSSF